MYNLLSVIYLVCYIASGCLMANWMMPKDRPVQRYWLGCVFGLFLLIWLPALFSFLFSFSVLSQLLALAVALTIGVAAFFMARRNSRNTTTQWKEELPLMLLTVPLFVLCVILTLTHTIQPRGNTLWVGQSTYGDLAMHLGFITSIAEQGTFPPNYSICPDTQVGYPFLSDSVSSTFYVLGSDLRFATMLPAIFALLLVIVGVYFFFESWMKKRGVAAFCALLFFVGGGFGFSYFLDLAQTQPGYFSRIFTAFYETPTNDPSLGLRWVNAIADMLIPQRATLFGWAFLFPCLHLLYRAAFDSETRLFPLLGLIAGGMPLIHTHSFLALGICSGFYLFRSFYCNEGRQQWLGYLKYAAIALLLALPQLLMFTFRQSGNGSFLRLNWNWDNVSDSFIWFYIKNLGLLFILLPIAFFGSEKKDRGVYGASLLLWGIAEIIQFQPNPYDNNKLLFVWFAFTCGLVGKWLCKMRQFLLEKVPDSKIATHLLCVFTCIALLLSGTLTLGREVVSEYQLFDSDAFDLAIYVKANTQPEDTFLTNNNHNNAIAALTGRNIVCGSGSYLFYHGVNYSARESALKLMYEMPELYFEEQAKKYSVDYVLIGPYEHSAYQCQDAFFDANYEVVYHSGNVKLYHID